MFWPLVHARFLAAISLPLFTAVAGAVQLVRSRREPASAASTQKWEPLDRALALVCGAAVIGSIALVLARMGWTGDDYGALLFAKEQPFQPIASLRFFSATLPMSLVVKLGWGHHLFLAMHGVSAAGAMIGLYQLLRRALFRRGESALAMAALVCAPDYLRLLGWPNSQHALGLAVYIWAMNFGDMALRSQGRRGLGWSLLAIGVTGFGAFVKFPVMVVIPGSLLVWGLFFVTPRPPLWRAVMLTAATGAIIALCVLVALPFSTDGGEMQKFGVSIAVVLSNLDSAYRHGIAPLLPRFRLALELLLVLAVARPLLCLAAPRQPRIFQWFLALSLLSAALVGGWLRWLSSINAAPNLLAPADTQLKLAYILSDAGPSFVGMVLQLAILVSAIAAVVAFARGRLGPEHLVALAPPLRRAFGWLAVAGKKVLGGLLLWFAASLPFLLNRFYFESYYAIYAVIWVGAAFAWLVGHLVRVGDVPWWGVLVIVVPMLPWNELPKEIYRQDIDAAVRGFYGELREAVRRPAEPCKVNIVAQCEAPDRTQQTSRWLQQALREGSGQAGLRWNTGFQSVFQLNGGPVPEVEASHYRNDGRACGGSLKLLYCRDGGFSRASGIE
jgi:hypothetical protein